jgi:hypothetical protein
VRKVVPSGDRDSQGVAGEIRDDPGDEVEGEGYFAELGVWEELTVEPERFGRSAFQAAASARKDDFRVGLLVVVDQFTVGRPSEVLRRWSEADFLRTCSLVAHMLSQQR